jgi:hypothetical protein
MGIARICGETPEFRHQDGMNIYFPVWSDQWRLDETMALSTEFGRDDGVIIEGDVERYRIPQTDAIQKAELSSILHHKYRQSSIDILIETRPFIVCSVSVVRLPSDLPILQLLSAPKIPPSTRPLPFPGQDSASKSEISLPPPKCHFQKATITFRAYDSAFNEATCLLRPRFRLQIRDFSSTTPISLPKRYNYFPPSMPLSTSPSMSLGSIDIYPVTDILVDVRWKISFPSGRTEAARRPRPWVPER